MAASSAPSQVMAHAGDSSPPTASSSNPSHSAGDGSTATPALLELTLTQLLAVPVSSIALGEGTRLAVLADMPYVGDARGLRPLPLPAMLRPKASEVDDVDIFFGRDNEPRIMGRRRAETGERAVYFRHLPSGWRDGREEIGKLGGPAPGGLWGVLGTADPELVCRAGAICIIKRTSGWTTVPAGEVARVVTLQDGALWGLERTGVSAIDAHGWTLTIPAPAWPEPQALWATHGEAWVSAEAELYHYRDGKWQTVPSPIGRAMSFWGARPDSLWLVGSAGAAHFDGRRFQRLAIAGPLHVVRGRTDAELWFGGAAGLFRAQPLDRSGG
jgi:hypothetical protein